MIQLYGRYWEAIPEFFKQFTLGQNYVIFALIALVTMTLFNLDDKNLFSRITIFGGLIAAFFPLTVISSYIGTILFVRLLPVFLALGFIFFILSIPTIYRWWKDKRACKCKECMEKIYQACDEKSTHTWYSYQKGAVCSCGFIRPVETVDDINSYRKRYYK